MIPRRKAKRDAAEPEVVSTLTDAGFAVERTSAPGWPDLLVSFRRRCWLVEVKSSHKGYGKGLNDNQKEFAARWRGPDIVILRSAQDAMDWAVQMSIETGTRCA